MWNKLLALACIVCFSVALTACGDATSNENTQETGTQSPTEEVTKDSTEEPTEAPERAEASTDEFEFYIIDYLTEAEVIETVYSVSEEGRPCVTVTHADGTTQCHELYEEQGEILWFADVKGENEGAWGGDYKIPGSEEVESTPATEAVHKHSYTETIITEALCNTTGTKRYTCSCGQSYDESYIDTWNHRSDGIRITITQPSCGEAGYGNTVETCVNCGQYINSIAIPPIDHTPASYWVYFPEQNLYVLGCVYCSYDFESTSTRPEGVEIHESGEIFFN